MEGEYHKGKSIELSITNKKAICETIKKNLAHTKKTIGNRTNKQLKKEINRSTHVKSVEKKNYMTSHHRI